MVDHFSDPSDREATDTHPLPAAMTKHHAVLRHPLPLGPVVELIQTVEGDTTGSTLWIGGQVLAAYLSSLGTGVARAGGRVRAGAGDGDGDRGDTWGGVGSGRPRALELGAGVGYLALTLAHEGYDVTATDVEPVLGGVLRVNVERSGGDVRVAEVDWVVVDEAERSRSEGGPSGEEITRLPSRAPPAAPAPESRTDSPSPSSSRSPSSPPHPLADLGTFDLLVTTDTIYAPRLVAPLWTTLTAIARAQARRPPLYIALERRDPALVDAAMQAGRDSGWDLRRVAHANVARAIERTGWGWGEEEWEGVEVWKGKWRGKRRK